MCCSGKQRECPDTYLTTKKKKIHSLNKIFRQNCLHWTYLVRNWERWERQTERERENRRLVVYKDTSQSARVILGVYGVLYCFKAKLSLPIKEKIEFNAILSTAPIPHLCKIKVLHIVSHKPRKYRTVIQLLFHEFSPMQDIYHSTKCHYLADMHIQPCQTTY